jgi:hypothetical protein
MRHVLAFILAAVCIAFAAVIVWSNRTALTTPHLAFAGGCLALGLALAAPADFKCACQTVAQYVPLLKKSGAP